MHVERLAYDGKEDPIWKTIGENSTDLALSTNDPEHVWIARGAICRNENFVDQVLTETAALATSSTASGLTLSGIEPNAQITVQSWPDALGGMLFPARAASVALGVMGLLAAIVAVTGIFGMAAYNVSRRMKELGIRVALGARW